MKKLILLIALGISLCANAQLTVFEDGQVRIGDYTLRGTSTADIDISSCIPQSMPSAFKKTAGSLSFGGGKNSRISGNNELETLSLYGGQRVSISVSNQSDAFLVNGTFRNITFTYDVNAPAFLTSSDMRLKSNVQSWREAYGKLEEVNAVSYNLSKSATSDSSAEAGKKSAASDQTVDDRMHFGFIAQEIQEIFPNLVVEGEDGMLAIDYTGFIPLLVEAYKDLSNKVKDQEEVIDMLIGQKGPSYMPASVNGLADSKASLKQNKPNPFNTTTTIECSVPQNVASAFICVYDLQGKQVHRIDIRERGDVVNVIDAAYFTPGMYIYALIADGVEIDSKRMIITD